MAGSKIQWSATSIKQFNAAMDYIADDSFQNAELVKNKILDKLEQTSRQPTSCPADEYKMNNDGRYRCLLLFHYRISYVIRKDEIEILRIRHTSMKPKSY